MNKPVTNYPERYRPMEDTPEFAEYVPCKPTSLGRSMYSILPPKDGTIVAAKNEKRFEEDIEYFLDQDMVMHDVPDVHYYIWLRDRWHRIQPPKYVRNREYQFASEIWPDNTEK